MAATATAAGAKRRRRGVVIVFGKAPLPGLVKTRMTPPLTAEIAARLYAHMLDDVLDATAGYADACGLDAVLALHPADACAAFANRVPTAFRVIAQRGHGLGERISWAVAEAAASGAERIVIRSSDGPVLSRALFEETIAALERHDVVVSPDLDGGYGLLGLHRPAPELFDHPMSTRTVLDELLAGAERLGLDCGLLPSSFDIDTAADLTHLARARAAGRTDCCPRTIAFLDGERLWPESPLLGADD